MIRWLHISDLHIKDRADWNNFERELLEKCKEFGKINIIIVTGDFHNFCEKENFILAKEFLVRLTEQLELDINKDLFIVVCLSEVYDSMLMWSHYAQNHRFGLMFILARR